jgi:hypothetical protein
MHIIPFFHHVKGHQDDKQEYTNKLPLEAQLNVEADHQVGSYYHMNLVDRIGTYDPWQQCKNDYQWIYYSLRL